MHKNGTLWKDMDGQSIQAHGGMILEHEGTYYWYGENKDGPTLADPNVGSRLDFIGISCYSSRDLHTWKYEGLVLPACKEPGCDLHPSMVGERPKVIYNEKNKEFVLWLHVDRADYTQAATGRAVSASPTGPFTYLGSIRPNGFDSRDFTIFQDDDGNAYLIHSSDWNRTLRVSQLTGDYKDFTGLCVKILTDQRREAPAIFKKDGRYYMVTSGCTGWECNPALYAVSDQLLSNWLLIDNPCTGPNARKTYYGQSTYIFQKDGQPYLMLDHWNPADLQQSGYSILPVRAQGLDMEIPWQEETF